MLKSFENIISLVDKGDIFDTFIAYKIIVTWIVVVTSSDEATFAT